MARNFLDKLAQTSLVANFPLCLLNPKGLQHRWLKDFVFGIMNNMIENLTKKCDEKCDNYPDII